MLNPEQKVQKAPLPTAKNLKKYDNPSQDVLVPLKESELNTASYSMGTPLPQVTMQGAAGSVRTAASSQALHSYGSTGGGGAIAQVGGARGSRISSSGGGSVSGMAVPQMSRRKRVSSEEDEQAKQEAAEIAKQAVAARQGVVLSTATTADNMALGYGAASGYITSTSGKRNAAPGTLGDWYNDILGGLEGSYTDGDITYVPYQDVYEAWLKETGGTHSPEAWEAFLEWFNGKENTKYRFPVADGLPYLLLLTLGYVLWLRRKKTITLSE